MSENEIKKMQVERGIHEKTKESLSFSSSRRIIMSNIKFNKQAILTLKEKINSKLHIPTTEEATKQWYVIPLLVALGYDPYSSDIIPEYTLDFGTKKGEKVDYALQINNQPVAIIECKQMDIQLGEKYISQLYRYFTVADVHIAILTNGNDLWLFTDSIKKNIMDTEPYLKLKISEITEKEIEKLELYSRDMIQYADISQLVQYERFQTACKELISGLKNNKIPSWLLDTLAERSGLANADKSILAEYLYNEIESTFGSLTKEKVAKKRSNKEEPVTSNKPISLGDRMRKTREANKEQKSQIKLNHLYTYNDYSDGNWTFHVLDYAIILGVRYNDITARALLLNTIEELFKQGKIERDAILKEEQFDKAFKINAIDNGRRMKYLEQYNVYVETSYSISDVIKFIERLLRYANLPDDSIKISFKE